MALSRSCVLQFTSYGWPDKPPDDPAFLTKKLELSTQDGVLLWGNKVVVPILGHLPILIYFYSRSYLFCFHPNFWIYLWFWNHSENQTTSTTSTQSTPTQKRYPKIQTNSPECYEHRLSLLNVTSLSISGKENAITFINLLIR